MKWSNWGKLFLALAFLSAMHQLRAAAAQRAPVQGQPLTVEQTLGAVFIRYEEGAPWNLFANANRDAKPALYRILANPGSAEHHPNAWRILGYIGDTADAEKMEQAVLERYSGVLTAREAGAVQAIFAGLGLMCRRDVQQAGDIIDRMCDVDYWRNVEFRWRPERSGVAPGFEYECISNVLNGYRLSRKADLKDKVASVVSKIGDPERRRYMEWRIDPARLTEAAEATWQAEKQPVSAGLRKAAVAVYRKQASIVAEEGELSEVEQAFIRETTREADDEFEKMKSAVIKGDYDALLNHLLDDGRIIDEKRLKRSWPEYEKDLARERQLFNLLADSEPSLRDYKVEKVSSYEFPSLDEEGAPVGATKVEPVSVSWRLEGSGEVGNVFFRRQKGSLTVARDGSLIVVMKKIDGRWYWNPFGW